MSFSCWWFRLYTLAYLRMLGLSTLAALLLDLALSRIAPDYAFMAFFVPLTSLITKFTPGSFRENIEFHKMNVPFRDLRRAFLIDVFLTGCSMVSVLGLCLLASHCFGLLSYGGPSLFSDLTLSMLMYYVLAAFLAVCWVCFIAVDRRYVFYGLKHRSFWGKVFFAGPIWMICFVIMVSGVLLHFEVLQSYVHLAGAMMMASVIFTYRGIFHKGPTHTGLWGWIKHYTLGNVIMASLFAMALLLGKSDAFDKDLSMQQRTASLRFYSYFGPRINKEAFVVFAGTYPAAVLYSKLDFDPSELGVKFFLDGDQGNLLEFMRRGRPGPGFLMSLYADMVSHPEHWSKLEMAEEIKYHAFHHWPKNKVLPEHYLAEKKKSDELQELRKKRHPASGR